MSYFIIWHHQKKYKNHLQPKNSVFIDFVSQTKVNIITAYNFNFLLVFKRKILVVILRMKIILHQLIIKHKLLNCLLIRSKKKISKACNWCIWKILRIINIRLSIFLPLFLLGLCFLFRTCSTCMWRIIWSAGSICDILYYLHCYDFLLLLVGWKSKRKIYK